MYAVVANYDGGEILIGQPFSEDDIPFVEKLIQIPVMTAYKTFQPEEMWIEDIGEPA